MPRKYCLRCGRLLLRDDGELWCLACGYRESEKKAENERLSKHELSPMPANSPKGLLARLPMRVRGVKLKV